MEIQEVERPFREIDISQVGPIIINSLTQINLDTGCIGKPGDLFSLQSSMTIFQTLDLR